MCYINYGSKAPCTVCGKFNYLTSPCDCNKPKQFNDFYTLPVDGGVYKCSICDKFHTTGQPCDIYDTDDLAERIKKRSDKECPGRSQIKCKKCGKCKGIFDKCCDTDTLDIPIVKKYTLEELYDELGKLKWVGIDEGWNNAVEVIRKHIVGKLK